MNTRKTIKRFVALLLTLVLVVITNMAISIAASSGDSDLPGTPKEISAAAELPFPPPF